MLDYLLLVLLPVVVLLDAWAQAVFTAVTRRYVPPEAQKQVNFALHILEPSMYAALLFAVAFATENIWVLVVGILLRIALFDVVLNKVKGDAPFHLGTSATTDKAIRKVASWVHVEPEKVSAGLRITSLLLAIGIAVMS